MLIRCIRLKRIHIKLFFLLSIIFVVIIISRLLLTDDIDNQKQTSRLYQNKTIYLEQKLRDYESRIISGLGDNGEPAFLDGVDASEGERALKKWALNYVLSDRMPLNRKLRDPRNKK